MLLSFSQNVVINEIMSSNSSALFDEFGETPDWIELYNTSSEVVNLENYSLSDRNCKFAKMGLSEYPS